MQINKDRKFNTGDNRWQEVNFGQTITISAKLNFSLGKIGVKCSNEILSLTTWGSWPFILDTFTKGKNFSPSFGGRTTPLTVSPVFKPNKRIWEVDK